MQRSVEDKPATRVYGSEVEYGVRKVERNYNYKRSLGRLTQQDQLATYTGLACLGNGFVENGARFYEDCSHNMEYAGPECTDLHDLVASEFAGEVIVSDFFANQLEGKAVPHKRVNEAEGEKGCGAHENYGTSLTEEEIFDNNEAKYILGTHLATRTIFTGAGCWRDEEFHIGQKPYFIEQFVSKNTTTNKPLLNRRMQPHSTEITRLHITSGDANIYPGNIIRKFGTTSLVLRMLEHGMAPTDLRLKWPKASAKFIARDPENMLEPLEMMDGSFASAVEIQQAFAEHAAELAEVVDLPEEEQQVIAEWLEIGNSLANDPTDASSPLHEELDWYQRKHASNQALARGKSPESLSILDMLFDQIGLELGQFMLAGKSNGHHPNQGTGIGYKLRQPAMVESGLRERVKAFLTDPPPTRASFRSQVIRGLSQENRNLRLGIDWGSFIAEGRAHIMDPPHSPEPSFDLDEELEKAHKRSN